MKRVADKVALITGGASGLGRQAAIRLVEEGASVVIADRNLPGAQAVAAALGERAFALSLDVTQEVEWIAAIAATLDHFGKLHVLVKRRDGSSGRLY